MADGLLTRAAFLRGAAGACGGLMLGGLASCGDDSASTATERPRKGGVLQFAVSDASQSEKLDPLPAVNQHHALYASMIWDFLLAVDDQFRPQPRLATSFTSNADANVWTFELRQDVKWHNGKPFVAKDVAWTLKRLLNKSNGSPVYSQVSDVLDPDGIEVRGDHVIVCRLKRRDALFPQVFLYDGGQIVPDGWQPDGNPANAVGTGPFIAKAFRPGDGFEVVRNPNYWDGVPYLDGARSVVIPDSASKLQSVLSGPSHVSDNVAPAQIKSTEGRAVDLVRVKDFYITYLTMDTRVKPFDNPDVRMAFKLAADREKMLNIAFAGYGSEGNDSSVPVGSKWVSSTLRRRRDPEMARALLAKAGYPGGIDVELTSAAVIGGLNEAAVAFAASAADAGIRVKIKQWAVDTYFDQVWLKKPFYVDYLGALHPLKALQLSFVQGAPYNETFLAGSKADDYVRRGLQEVDEAKRDAIAAEAMRWQADAEGIITTGFLDKLKISKKTLRGATYSKNGQGDYGRAWLAG